MRVLKLILILPLLVATLALPLVIRGTVLAVDQNSKDAACEGIGLAGDSCDEAQADEEVDNLVAATVNVLSWIVGVASIIMIIIGGFKYITAQGDTNAVASAKTTIIYALVGLVVALLAQVLVQFVIMETTK
jgi:hypothetical protein